MYRFWVWVINFCLKRIEQDSNLISHAKREFVALGYDLEDKEEGPNKWIIGNVIVLLSLFSSQGHSGSSAPFCVSYFKNLASWEPLCPLTGKSEEWNEVGENLFQNKRCSHVFMENVKEGFNKPNTVRAYDGEGKIFRDKNGSCYTSSESRVDITFPYTPKTEYVDVST